MNSSSYSYYQDAWRRLRQNNVAMCGFYIILFFIFMATIGPFLSSWSYYETHLSLKNIPPCLEYPFGTDELGRSMFVRIWWGARISLFVGFAAATIDMVIGVFYGALCGMLGGKADELLMRVADVLYSLPHLLIVILLMVVLGSGLITILIAMTFTGWINMARITRGQIMQLRERDFVLAAKVMGASHMRILCRHLIPNTVGSIITTMTLTIPTAIFTEAFLSFLGLGVQAPVASWGTMASDGLSALRYYPWRLFFPAAFISIAMLALNLLGNGMRDAFDPRLRT